MKFEGTRGYMGPEFQSTGVATQKSDVFAFGIVILELLSGEEPLKYRFDDSGGVYTRVSVIETARAAVDGGGRLRRWMDKRLKDSYPEEVVEKLTRIGLECVEEDPNRRPDMRWIVGRISKLFLESQTWSEKMGVPTDFITVSLAPSERIKQRRFLLFYRGIASNIASSAPISAVYTFTYESVKGALLPLFAKEYHPLAHCVAGGCASIATSFIFTPSERIKQQMQVSSHYQSCW